MLKLNKNLGFFGEQHKANYWILRLHVCCRFAEEMGSISLILLVGFFLSFFQDFETFWPILIILYKNIDISEMIKFLRSS